VTGTVGSVGKEEACSGSVAEEGAGEGSIGEAVDV